MHKTSYSRRPVEKLATALANGAITDDAASRMLREVGHGADKANCAIFNLKDSALYVGISEGHFRRLVDEGVFPSITLGRSRWWRRVDLEKALESRVVRKVGGKTESVTANSVVCMDPVASPAPASAAA